MVVTVEYQSEAFEMNSKETNQNNQENWQPAQQNQNLWNKIKAFIRDYGTFIVLLITWVAILLTTPKNTYELAFGRIERFRDIIRVLYLPIFYSTATLIVYILCSLNIKIRNKKKMKEFIEIIKTLSLILKTNETTNFFNAFRDATANLSEREIDIIQNKLSVILSWFANLEEATKIKSCNLELSIHILDSILKEISMVCFNLYSYQNAYKISSKITKPLKVSTMKNLDKSYEIFREELRKFYKKNDYIESYQSISHYSKLDELETFGR